MCLQNFLREVGVQTDVSLALVRRERVDPITRDAELGHDSRSKSKGEQKLLGPVGSRLSTAGKGAIDAAREAGTAKLSELNLTRDAGADVVKKVLSGLGEVARTSGEAAVGTIRKG